jgi:FkbM family methyltransferase
MMVYDKIRGLNINTIVEAGGNVGQDTRKLCKMFPEASVHTCEPIDFLFQGLQTLKRELPNLHLYQVALSDTTGTTEFFVDLNSKGSMGASSILEAHPDFKIYLDGEEKISVSCIRLDDFLHRVGIKKLGLLWLDIEMMEYRVLKASESILRDISYIYTEISYSNFRVGQPTVNDLEGLLSSCGFERVFIEPQGSQNFDWQANALYKKT